jgi:hypothetical protein
VIIADSKLYGEPLARAEAEHRIGLSVDWRRPTSVELEAFSKHRRLSKVADALIAAADVDSESWILLERDWSGFPDPPPFAFFAYASDGKTICEADLEQPSPSWRLPDGVPFKPAPKN